MTQFDVYENPNPASLKTIPFLIDVQTNLLDNRNVIVAALDFLITRI